MYANARNMSGARRITVVKDQASTLLAHFDLSFHYRRTKMISRILGTLLATLFVASVFGTLAGCNTIEGAGQDIQQGGHAISEEAREHNRR